MNTDAFILVYKFRPERTGFNMYAEYTRPQLTFLALHPCIYIFTFKGCVGIILSDSPFFKRPLKAFFYPV